MMFAVGLWPGRKRPVLTVFDETTHLHTVLAYFTSKEAAEEFVRLIKAPMKNGSEQVH